MLTVIVIGLLVVAFTDAIVKKVKSGQRAWTRNEIRSLVPWWSYSLNRTCTFFLLSNYAPLRATHASHWIPASHYPHSQYKKSVQVTLIPPEPEYARKLQIILCYIQNLHWLKRGLSFKINAPTTAKVIDTVCQAWITRTRLMSPTINIIFF